ncbi:methylthioribulose 1-phosphate dehydratase [Yinghuangia soli]|uniref:Methylthioribulose-1-phosphate dehydratase n=1 Tax=Yinghuangia soli TaxID=2908204 RepID=A0AA41PWL6_9ACTN|nr:methylthioribulose 1-phosphate dehydratase [Yinghuangia soli]MCF2527200.1 methylthioribulose 1-phosphate dehydratase [Yinghuangia soli]
MTTSAAVPAAPDSPAVTAADRAAAGAVLAREAARFAGLGWMRGTSGNLSVVISSDPVRLAVTASGIDKGELGPDDVVVVDGAGTVAAADQGPGAPRKPSAEAALHARVVALSGARAVFHVHTIEAVRAGARWPGGIEFSDLEILKGIGRSAHDEKVVIPVIANSQDMACLGDRLAAVFDERVPAVVVAEHGMYVWGANPMQARHHVEVVQWLLEYKVATG